MVMPHSVARLLPSEFKVRVRRSEPSSNSTSCSSIRLFRDSLLEFEALNLPLTTNRSAPFRSRSESVFPPRTRDNAVRTIVLPAPVSPVMTFNPGANSMVALSITPSPLMETSSSRVLPSRLVSLTSPTINWELEFRNQAISEGDII